ncbi:MAG: hypothetical protein U1F68_17305 [Gammaproteobacteria bacterium]
MVQIGMATLQKIPRALTNFDRLPDAAYVRVDVVAALIASDPVTVWRRSKSGALPEPRKLSPGVTAWNVGELRKVLAALPPATDAHETWRERSSRGGQTRQRKRREVSTDSAA